MDGIHDLGGREGFGPIATSTDDPAFPETWEGRVYAMVQTVGPPGGTIDWFRNLVELLPPEAYLTERYFQKWQLTHMVEMLQADMLSLQEVISGSPANHAPLPEAQTVTQVLDRIQAKGRSFEAPASAAPAFAIGQQVRTRRNMAATHTRLPGYARNRTGQVIAHHGGHVLPDESARGVEVGVHLYSVRFTAEEVWGPPANPRDDVILDVWESYLVPA